MRCCLGQAELQPLASLSYFFSLLLLIQQPRPYTSWPAKSVLRQAGRREEGEMQALARKRGLVC